MPRLLTGIDWLDHGLLPRSEPSEPTEEELSVPEDEQDDEERASLDERCWWLRESRKRMRPFWWADE